MEEEDKQRKRNENFSTNNSKEEKAQKKKHLQLFFKIKSALIKRTSINHDAPHERREEE